MADNRSSSDTQCHEILGKEDIAAQLQAPKAVEDQKHEAATAEEAAAGGKVKRRIAAWSDDDDE